MAAPIVSRIGPQLTGLRPSLQELIKTATPDPQHPDEELRRLLRASLLPIVIQEIRVRDAGPLLQLLRLPLAGPGFDVPRVLPNRQQILSVADAADLVLVLIDPILPGLRRLPTDATYLRIVDAAAANLRDFARSAGGSFNKASMELANRLTLLTDAARAHPMFSPYAPLYDSIDDLLRDGRRFLDKTFTIKQPEVAEAAEAVAHTAAAAAAALGDADADGVEAEDVAEVEDDAGADAGAQI